MNLSWRGVFVSSNATIAKLFVRRGVATVAWSRTKHFTLHAIKPTLPLTLNRVCRSYSNCKTKPRPPWKVIFFGTDNFALKSVQPLCAKL